MAAAAEDDGGFEYHDINFKVRPEGGEGEGHRERGGGEGVGRVEVEEEEEASPGGDKGIGSRGAARRRNRPVAATEWMPCFRLCHGGRCMRQ